MKAKLAEHLTKARDTIAEMDRILAAQKYRSDARTVAVSGLLATITQHHRSVILLINSGSLRSAGALVRVIVEAMYFGLWMNASPTAEEIKRIRADDEFPVDVQTVVKAVNAAYKGNALFEEIKKRCGAPLYQVNRAGILQLGRWSLDKEAGLRNDEQELMEITKTATLCVLFLGAEFLAKQNRAAESKAVQALATK